MRQGSPWATALGGWFELISAFGLAQQNDKPNVSEFAHLDARDCWASQTECYPTSSGRAPLNQRKQTEQNVEGSGAAVSLTGNPYSLRRCGSE